MSYSIFPTIYITIICVNLLFNGPGLQLKFKGELTLNMGSMLLFAMKEIWANRVFERI
jgi:hypothetical protein